MAKKPSKPAPRDAADLRAAWAEKEARILSRELPFRRVHVLMETRELAVALEAAREAETVADKALRAVPEGEDNAAQLQAYADATTARLEAQEAVDEDVETLDFEGLWRSDYEELIGQHPPTEQQLKQEQEYNVETFAPALLAACSLDGMDESGAERLLAGMSQTEAGLLFNTCIALCEQARLSLVPGARRSA